MSNKKTLATVVLSAFALIFVYQFFNQVLFALSDQGGVVREYADKSKQGHKEFEKALAESRATTELLSTDSSVSEPESNEGSSFRFPQSNCGDTPTGADDTWYPVFVDGGDLKSIRTNYCADAIATKRKDTGVETVQLASLTSRERALELAQAVGGDVGEPTIPQANLNDEPSQQTSVEVNPIEPTASEIQIQQQQAQQKTIEAANLCHEQHIAAKESTTQLKAAQIGIQDNIVTDYVNSMTESIDDLGEVALQQCLAKAQQQR